MNTATRGRNFEDEVFAAIGQAVALGRLGLMPSACQVFQRKKYYSRDREAHIEIDVSIEITADDASNWSLLWAWECKDYDSAVPVSDIEEFWAKLQQIGGANVKGGIVTNSSLQKGALRFAKSKGIAVVRILPDRQIRWVLADAVAEDEEIIRRALLCQDYIGINRSFYCLDGGMPVDDWNSLLVSWVSHLHTGARDTTGISS